MEGFHNSPNYFQKLWKKLFAIIRLGLLTFFVTFTSIKRLWDLLIKSLPILHASKLNLSIKIKDFQSIHITKLIWVDPVTCARYYNHKTSGFHKLITKDDYIFGYICIYNLLLLFIFHHWIPKSWERTWPWIFMDKKCTYVWSAHKWKNWTIYKHIYFLWCIIVIKLITKCTTTPTHTYM